MKNMDMDIKFLVGIRCMTFNHAAYIEDAMNGFSMQQTSFPFVCVIVDDASTDGEPCVINEYLQKYFNLEDVSIVRNEETDDYVATFCQHKTNRNCYFAVYYLKYNHYGKKKKDAYFEHLLSPCKYIAICEGDDYWTVPDKLQKQVDILERNEDVMMVHTGFNCVDEHGNIIERDYYKKNKERSKSGDCLLDLMINGNYPMTLTTMFRKEVFCSPIYKTCPTFIDYALFLIAASLGNFVYLPEDYGCYRYSPQGFMATRKEFLKGLQAKAYFYICKCIRNGLTKKIKWSVRFKIHLHIYTSSLITYKLKKM